MKTHNLYLHLWLRRSHFNDDHWIIKRTHLSESKTTPVSWSGSTVSYDDYLTVLPFDFETEDFVVEINAK